MAYSKNEKKLKEFLKKQNDIKQTSKPIKRDSVKPPDDKNIRGRRHL